MSLATTCPNCGTCFRVVQDQLRVSEGWVRCGNCQNVFNALESLFDLDAPRDPIDTPDTSTWRDPTRGVWQTETSARWMRQVEASSWPEPEHDPGPSFVDASAGDPPEREEPLSDSVRAALHAEPMAHAGADEDEVPAAFEAAQVADAAPVPEPHSPPAATLTHEHEARIEPAFEETIYASAGLLTAELPMAFPQELGPEAEATRPADEPDPTAADSLPADWPAGPPETTTSGGGAAVDTQDLDAATPAPPAEKGITEPAFEAPATPANTPDTAIATADSIAEVPSEAAGSPSPIELPGFVLAAERQARWQRPGARIALGLASLLMMAALAGQAVWHWRDLLAATWAPARAPLHSLCEAVGCELAAPRRLEALVVDNTTLTRPPGVSGYRLGVHLRNRADHPVAAPSFDLVLTDAQGTMLSRRTIRPEDFDFHQAALEAQAEAQWTLEFSLNEGSLVGYTLAAFYP